MFCANYTIFAKRIVKKKMFRMNPRIDIVTPMYAHIKTEVTVIVLLLL